MPQGGFGIVATTLRANIYEVRSREEDFPKLFEKFRQLDASHTRRYEGTGLGLALTKQLVELNGGTMHVTTVFGRGSTFTFTVPAALDAVCNQGMHATIPV